jgi:hypothetical protein
VNPMLESKVWGSIGSKGGKVRGGGGQGSKELMYIAGFEDRVVVRVIVGDDKLQEGGQREKRRREVVQSSSGLWAFSQSVPRMISWVPTSVM